jgi:amino acid permease
MRLRRPARRKFRSTIHERRRRQREYYYASFSILVVKIILFVFLAVLFVVSLRLFHYRFTHVHPMIRYIIPSLVAAIAALIAYYIYNNIKEIKELRNK